MDVCRICLKKSLSLKPLYSERNNLATRINDLFNFDFEIIKIETQPQKICYDCLTDLHHSFKFYENASFAQHQLNLQQETVEESKDEDGIIRIEVENISDSNDVSEIETQENNDNELNKIIQVIVEKDIHDLDETEEYIIEENYSVYQEENVRQTDNESLEENPSLIHHDSTIARTYACEICLKTYNKKGSFLYHMKTKHVKADDREFQCLVCQKRFAMKGDYTRHTRIHTNEKRFACGECGKKFTDRSTHLKHEKMHTGIKPHKCELCFKSFSHKFVLDNHYLTHTGEKNFVCPDCCRRFARKSKMKDHIIRVHKRPFSEDDVERSKLLLETLSNENCSFDVK